MASKELEHPEQPQFPQELHGNRRAKVVYEDSLQAGALIIDALFDENFTRRPLLSPDYYERNRTFIKGIHTLSAAFDLTSGTTKSRPKWFAIAYGDMGQRGMLPHIQSDKDYKAAVEKGEPVDFPKIVRKKIKEQELATLDDIE